MNHFNLFILLGILAVHFHSTRGAAIELSVAGMLTTQGDTTRATKALVKRSNPEVNTTAAATVGAYKAGTVMAAVIPTALIVVLAALAVVVTLTMKRRRDRPDTKPIHTISGYQHARHGQSNPDIILRDVRDIGDMRDMRDRRDVRDVRDTLDIRDRRETLDRRGVGYSRGSLDRRDVPGSLDRRDVPGSLDKWGSLDRRNLQDSLDRRGRSDPLDRPDIYATPDRLDRSRPRDRRGSPDRHGISGSLDRRGMNGSPDRHAISSSLDRRVMTGSLDRRNLLEMEAARLQSDQDLLTSIRRDMRGSTDRLGISSSLDRRGKSGQLDRHALLEIEANGLHSDRDLLDDRRDSLDRQDLSEVETSQEASESLDDSIRQNVLRVLERAYPNPLPEPEITRSSSAELKDVRDALHKLREKDIVVPVDDRWVRNPVTTKHKIQKVIGPLRNISQMLQDHEQPTVAVICVHFCERLAILAMMENKVTFVRYKTEGKSKEYTMGRIGRRQVVCLKLSSVNHDRIAQISAANATTRLLGIFQKVEHVILVGCGGGSPSRQIRLGDIVASFPSDLQQDHIYMKCEDIDQQGEGDIKSWRPSNSVLLNIIGKLVINHGGQMTQYMEEARQELSAHNLAMEFKRPPGVEDTKVNVLGGVIGSRRNLMHNDRLRQLIAIKYDILAFDEDCDQVLDATVGSGKRSYAIIRSIADYRDGSSDAQWQPFAALAAAAFMKTVVMEL